MVVLSVHCAFANLTSANVFQNRRVDFHVMGRRLTNLGDTHADYSVSRMTLLPCSSIQSKLNFIKQSLAMPVPHIAELWTIHRLQITNDDKTVCSGRML